MSMLKKLGLIFVFGMALLATGCATQTPYDYSAFKMSRPKSVLILPPLNSSPDINATNSVYSQLTYPLAEAGYYVMPVAVVDETFKQNGVGSAGEIHDLPLDKLRNIFGADAALYVDIKTYGTSYKIISSNTVVSATAKLVDLRNGTVLWQGAATASSNEGQSNSGGLVGMLVKAVVDQIANTLTERSHQIAGITSQRLLAAGRPNGVLYGPRSDRYQSEK